MLEVLRKYLDSIVGISEMPRERAEKLVAELTKRGEIRAKDLQSAVQEVVKRSARNRRELVRLVQKEIQRQVGVLGLATRADVERLQHRVKTLESTAKRAAAPGAKAAVKKPAPKRTASTKS